MERGTENLEVLSMEELQKELRLADKILDAVLIRQQRIREVMDSKRLRPVYTGPERRRA